MLGLAVEHIAGECGEDFDVPEEVIEAVVLGHSAFDHIEAVSYTHLGAGSGQHQPAYAGNYV